jgi:hypothetical protein
MRIHHITNGISIIVTNEERQFMSKNDDYDITIESLDDHEQWIAQNLIRKGVYTLSKDKKNITRVDDARQSL